MPGVLWKASAKAGLWMEPGLNISSMVLFCCIVGSVSSQVQGEPDYLCIVNSIYCNLPIGRSTYRPEIKNHALWSFACRDCEWRIAKLVEETRRVCAGMRAQCKQRMKQPMQRWLPSGQVSGSGQWGWVSGFRLRGRS